MSELFEFNIKISNEEKDKMIIDLIKSTIAKRIERLPDGRRRTRHISVKSIVTKIARACLDLNPNHPLQHQWNRYAIVAGIMQQEKRFELWNQKENPTPKCMIFALKKEHW